MVTLDIKSMSLEELKEYMESISEKPYRAGQIFNWLHEREVTSFQDMSSLSKELRKKLEENAYIAAANPVKVLESKKDSTKKFLFSLNDGEYIESVLMKYEYGYSVCISSQVGCRMDCSFCATGKGGLIRDLTPSEMLDQVYAIERYLGQKISRVVVMGMGEPLDNIDSLLRFIELICHEKGRNLGQRHITVSTCGLVPGIKKLADKELQITLAISLHSALDSKRSDIMPVNKAYPLEELLKAGEYYYNKTKRRITFEYALIHGVNDGEEDCLALSKAAKKLLAHVNLIPVNPVVENKDYMPPTGAYIRSFQNMLEKSGINVTIRREMGRDINGACGQLRAANKADAR